MSLNDKTPDHHVAYGAAIEGFSAVTASMAVVGRYWWNLQMRLLAATGTMRFFRAHWWLFVIVGFLLLAFVFPLGVAFVLSAFCAGAMDPKAKDNFIVPLRQDGIKATAHTDEEPGEDVASVSQPDTLEDVRLAAGVHHVGYLRAIDREVDDSEFAAAALGAFDGTVQAFGVTLSDLDMHTMGAAFIAGQLKDLGRMGEVDPEWIAKVTIEAMSCGKLNATRLEAGRMAYAMVGAMQVGPAQSA
jgi:hypothetical protein